MAGRSNASHPEAELAWIVFDMGDELRDRRGRHRGIYHHEIGLSANASDWRDVARYVETELLVERSIDHVWCPNGEQRVTVRSRTHDQLGADIAAGARAVLRDELLAETFREPLPDLTRENVARAACRETYDHSHRPHRVGCLRPCNSRYRRQNGRGPCEAYKASTRKVHDLPSGIEAVICFELRLDLDRGGNLVSWQFLSCDLTIAK